MRGPGCGKPTQEAKDTISAKRIGDKIRPNEHWTDTKESVMTETIENKCEQVQMFREMLRSVKKTLSSRNQLSTIHGAQVLIKRVQKILRLSFGLERIFSGKSSIK